MKAAAKMAALAHVRFWTEPIPAVEALGVPALVRCETGPIRVAEKIHAVRPGVTAADRTVAAIHCAKEADRTDAEIHCAMDDQCHDWNHGLVLNAANHPNRVTNRVMDCCVRFQASCA